MDVLRDGIAVQLAPLEYGTSALDYQGDRKQSILVAATCYSQRQRSFYLCLPLSGYLVEDTSGMRKIILVVLLTFIGLAAQGAQAQATAFRVVVVEGEGALNNVETRAARELAVRVLDSAGRPVAGATVEFDGPGSGAGELFADGSPHFAATTDATGIARAPGARNNGVAGSFGTTVHVSYQGRSIGEASIHQTNVSRQVADIANKLQSNAATQAGGLALSASVVGIASGDQFLVNGAPTPGNANLLNSTRLQTLASPTTLFLHDNCEFLEGPHSSVLVSPNAVAIENGAVRATRLWVTTKGNADGVVAITNDAMEVAAVSGELQVVNGLGDIVGTVAPGTVSSFGLTSLASGATAGGAPAAATSTRNKVLLGTAAAAGLAGLGLAISAAATSSPTSP